MANSGAILQLPESYFDLVRAGILFYGARPSSEVPATVPVRQALRWVTRVVFFKVVKGKRTILQTIRGVSTSTRTWHTLTGAIAGKELTVELDGKERFKRTLDREPTGRCGLWSKADSKVLFDDFEARP